MFAGHMLYSAAHTLGACVWLTVTYIKLNFTRDEAQGTLADACGVSGGQPHHNDPLLLFL